MRYVCLVHFDPQVVFNQSPEAQAVLGAVGPHDTGETDWTQIAALYDVLHRVDPSSVVALNRAVAIGMRDGPEAGLTNIEAVLARGRLDDYHLAHAARADMQRRLGLTGAARASYQRALELTRQPAELRFLRQRLTQLDGQHTGVNE